MGRAGQGGSGKGRVRLGISEVCSSWKNGCLM